MSKTAEAQRRYRSANSRKGSFSFQHDESVQKLDNRAVSEFEQAVHDVLSDFGLPDDTVTRINGYMLNIGRGTEGLAGANGFDQISLNPNISQIIQKPAKFKMMGIR